MFEFLSRNPWTIGMLIPLAAVAIGPIAYYWHLHQRDRMDAELKLAMIQRGMSADEIVRVLSAGRETVDEHAASHAEGRAQQAAAAR